ncbi:hypothetical protein GCM10025866_32840 [Naasia aerilata]|uniref:AMP-dependent synthetase/ligase domain-containing protein n=1 Tax=Naasia aerilata TaxID=1162966 RepID=A0ABN6XUP9_9MICO|nr:hypothetical protein GCM10025866_32840 [Naasia aerilata]
MHQIDAPAVVAPTPDANATDLLLERVAKTPDAPLFARHLGEQWIDVSARDYLDQVRALAKGFIAAGIQPGEKIGLMAKTRYEWTLIDFAAWFAGAILVPIYETSSPARCTGTSATPVHTRSSWRARTSSRSSTRCTRTCRMCA